MIAAKRHQPDLFSATRNSVGVSILVHSLILSIHLLHCHPLRLAPSKEFPIGPDIDAYMIVFGIDDRRSFTSAVDLLYRLRKDDVHNSIVVLVANKVDLVRNRVVTTEEAKAVASSYDCKYIETSTVLNHNLDELLVCMVTQIRHRQRKARSSHERSSQKSRSPVSPKHLFNKLFRRGSISKSYENLSEN
ncbi:unnamed protein product [Acanthosepion pharaonis]|uniref:Uncharacterized protein n=1 Tax=Acanthosepion pharaonis TaxID=158019 RepID=A0A812CB17_ACAPH|nr:unnamed protein product [Sepia pharaonis]